VAGDGAGGRQPSLHHVVGDDDAQSLVYGLGLEHHALAQASKRRIGDDSIERRPGQCADGIEADVAPQLEPDVPAHLLAHRRFEAGVDEGLAQGCDPRRAAAVRLAQNESVERVVHDDARLGHLACRFDDAADGTLRSDGVPLPVVQIHGREAATLEAAAALVEVPPGDPVHRRDHGGRRTEERSEVRRSGIRLMRLERADHEILVSELARVLARRQARNFLGALGPELEAMLSDRAKVRAARDHANFVTGQRELDRDVPADRARTVDAKSHRLSSRQKSTRNAVCRPFPRVPCRQAPTGRGGASVGRTEPWIAVR
jgi:hypothetical protein